MSYRIAITGKGGTGKTTFSALLIKSLVSRGLGPVLGVDADPNSNLAQALGIESTKTIGSLREEMMEKVQSMSLPPGFSKQELFQMQIEQALLEGKDFDLLTMGRPEGPGCYCAINNMLRTFIDNLSEHYRFIIIDNEAGMEHLSRRTNRSANVMFIMSDASMRGLETAARIRDLAEEMEIDVENYLLVLSRVSEPVDRNLSETIDSMNLVLSGVVPFDPEIFARDSKGESVADIPVDSPARSAVEQILDQVFKGVKV
ncbi:MAG: AAA family ATPase [Actinomycetota bacterium]|nr:AAA family ATPase [Actinomycetota bacterium]